MPTHDSEVAPFIAEDSARPRHGGHAFGQRHVVFLLCFACSAICYADRTNLSVALVAMRREFGIGEREAGTLLAAFFFGYLFTQVPGGLLSARFGAKRTLMGGVIIWSALTLITPWCAYNSKGTLLAVRACVGLAEGVAIPAIQSLIAAWSPPLERSRWLALVGSGAFVGTVLAFSCARMVDWWWPAIFYLFGGLGFVWAAVFALCATSSPADNPWISGAELACIGGASAGAADGADGTDGPGGGGGGDASDASSWRRMLSEPAFLGICTAHFSINWGHYLLLSWLPQFLTSLGLQLGSAAALFATPYICAACVDNAGGWVADDLLQKRLGWGVRRTRRLMQSVAHGVAITCFSGLCFTRDPYFATALLTVAISGSSLSHAGYWPNLIEICGGRPEPTAVLTGVANTVGTLPGIIANWLTGRMLDAPGGSWPQVFALAIGVYSIGILAYIKTAQGHDLLGGGALRRRLSDDENAAGYTPVSKAGFTTFGSKGTLASAEDA